MYCSQRPAKDTTKPVVVAIRLITQPKTCVRCSSWVLHFQVCRPQERPARRDQGDIWPGALPFPRERAVHLQVQLPSRGGHEAKQQVWMSTNIVSYRYISSVRHPRACTGFSPLCQQTGKRLYMKCGVQTCHMKRADPVFVFRCVWKMSKQMIYWEIGVVWCASID